MPQTAAFAIPFSPGEKVPEGRMSGSDSRLS
jgi:hypothetical protein